MKIRTMWRTGLAVVACTGLAVGLLLACSCAESKLDKVVTADNAGAATAEAAAAAATTKKNTLDAAVAAAKAAALNPDGTSDPAKEYAALVRAVPEPADRSVIAASVAAGKTPSQAAIDMAGLAAQDAVKYAAQAKDLRDAAIAAEAQRAAARVQDTAAWTAGIHGISTAADLFWPGVGALAGGVGLMVVNKLRGNTFADGQDDGAAQVAQGIATIRKVSPAVDTALSQVGPMLKKIVAATMDDNVAAAVAANRDTPADGTHDLTPAFVAAPPVQPVSLGAAVPSLATP